ncbi:preprotein translocase subunit YajC [Nocardioides sp.]|uniref:preprotein translocase subunit YajC n=1 Tax=Nocardioides sp. TaxID=35761 RepID=UPI0035692BBC
MQDVASVLLPLAAFVLIFWLLIVRPQTRRQRELGAMQQALSVGDEVMLTSGVFGAVTAIEDDVVHVQVAPGVSIKVARGAIGRVIAPSDDDDMSSAAELDEAGQHQDARPDAGEAEENN